ncbi:MAG: AMP-binding protein [Christensenellaceae bacterium]|nr:AMP-binding protein [Christensenellaceae bacterium]
MSIVKSFFQTLEFKFASEEKRKEVTNKRLHELVDYARKHSPFLAELYKDLKDDYKLEDIPIVNKKMIMENYDRWTTDPNVKLEELLAFTSDTNNIGKRYRNYLVCKTSGTTSFPLIMLHDQNFLNNTTAESLFLGTMSHTPIAFINPLQLFVIPVCMVRDNLRRFPFIRKSFHLLDTMAPMEDLIRDLNRIQPKSLYTQPSIAELLADEQVKGNLKLDIKEIVCNSEALPEGTREYLIRVFGCKVESIYGCTELGNVAVECENKRHHLDSFWNIIEFMDENNKPVKNGEKTAKLVVTNLSDRVLPIIRYEVNDKLIYREDDGNCPCGRKRDWIDIEGRAGVDLVLLQGEGELRRVYLEDPRYMCTCVVEGLRRLQLAVHGYKEIECRVIIEDYVDQTAAKEKIRTIIADYVRGYGIKDCKVYVSETKPQLDPVSMKIKDIFQDQIEK